MTIATDGFGTIIDQLISGGGGGATIIPNGGTLAGTYNGVVICQGNASLVGNVDINGSLVVAGTLSNFDGNPLTVHGDVYAFGVNFVRTDPTKQQSDIVVDGNFKVNANLTFTQSGGSAKTIRVGGDLVVTSPGGPSLSLLGYGVPDTNTDGCNLIVSGSIKADIINLTGSPGATVNAGNGGTIECSDITALTIVSYGGDANGYAAGQGGSLLITGDVISMSIDISGGDSSGATGLDGGDGGTMLSTGNILVDSFESTGGGCASDDQTKRSGSGGSVICYGDCKVLTLMDVSGGQRSGLLSLQDSLSPPDAGDIEVYGDFTLGNPQFLGPNTPSLIGIGGAVLTTVFAPHSAGSGSNVYVGGDFNGGISSGNSFNQGQVIISGGNSLFSNGGNGGNFVVRGAIKTSNDGTAFPPSHTILLAYGGSSNNGTAGNGGSLLAGSAYLSGVDLSGGNGFTQANGGSGGAVFINGHLTLEDLIQLNGGSCTSDDETYTPGSAGSITCSGIDSFWATIYCNGGDRFGLTTVSTTNPAMSGGFLECRGYAMLGLVQCNGGSVITQSPNAPGGNGGSVVIVGTQSTGIIRCNGGGSLGKPGGNGGGVSITGHATCVEIEANGGPSNSSVTPGGDANFNGSGGLVSLYSGCAIGSISLLDGTGIGSIPVNGGKLSLSGYCSVGTISIDNKPNSWIYSAGTSSDQPATLRVWVLTLKNTLNTNTGGASGPIAAFNQTSSFISTNGSVWYRQTGIAV